MLFSFLSFYLHLLFSGLISSSLVSVSLSNRRVVTFPPSYAQEYDGGSLYAINIAFIILEIIFVALRFYARYLSNAKLGVDDILMVPALIVVISVAVLSNGMHTTVL